jgi:hypothetical protein
VFCCNIWFLLQGEHGFGKPDERAYLHAMQAHWA